MAEAGFIMVDQTKDSPKQSGLNARGGSLDRQPGLPNKSVEYISKMGVN